jgi:nicotinate dehydrogenase subunit B
MNANTEFSLSRRTMLQGTGALVITFSMGGTTQAVAQMPVMAAPAAPKGALHPTDLDSWLSIGRDGKVTLFFGKIDGGQGTDLAMGQIVAEELDVPMSSVTVIQGDTALTINQGGASGSTGVRFAGAAFRQAGAEARRVLVTRAAERLGVGPADRQ